MNPIIKERWAKALPTYPQQREGYLRTPNGFCGLGVLCDLYSKETNTPWEVDDYHHRNEEGEFQPNFYYFGEESLYLPKQVMEWAGLDVDNPFVVIDGEPMPFSDSNDKGKSFEELAQIIKDQL